MGGAGAEQGPALTSRNLHATRCRGGKGTCFAYGQTGSGKTYTMSPLPLRAAGDIFGIVAQPAYGGLALHVR